MTYIGRDPSSGQYNWFLHDAASNLLALLKIDEPTQQQELQAQRVIISTCGYVRSKVGN